MAKEEKKAVVPKLRFPEFRAGPEWMAQMLGPMTSKVGSGITPLGGDTNYKTQGRPFVRSQNVGWGELLLNDVAYIDEETHRAFDATEIKENDVLLNITGASIGRSVVADSRIVGGNVNQHVCIIRAKVDELSPVLLNQFLISERGQKQIDGFQAGGNRQGLNFAQIRSFEIPVPPTAREQQRVADCLSSLDELIAAQRRKVEALKTYKRGLMQQLFPREGATLPRLRFPEFRDAPEWEEHLLSKISPVIYDGTHQTPSYTSEGVPFYSVENLISGNANKFISHDDYLEATRKNRPQKDDILLTRIGKIGHSVVVTWDHEFSVYVTLAVIQRAPKFNSHYMHYFIQSQRYQAELRSKSLPNAVPPKINLDSLRSTKVLLPEKDEQQRIADSLAALDNQISGASAKLNNLRSHKKGLMQQLFPSLEEVEA